MIKGKVKVKEVMSKDIITVKRYHTLKQLLELFAHFHLFPLVAVVEDDNKLVGSVSFRDILNVFQPYQSGLLKRVLFVEEEEEDIFQVEFTKEIGMLVVIEDIMESKFAAINEDAPIEEAYKEMKLNFKEELPVIDNRGRLVGMIGIFDIIRQIFRLKGII